VGRAPSSDRLLLLGVCACGCGRADLEAKLQEADAAGARIKLIATDGAFSMDGEIAPLDKIVALADKYHGT
jgi:glycine C-acetyltransferase